MRVLGVDGGQSAIRVRLSDDERVVEVEGVSHGEGDVVTAVGDAVGRGWRDAGSEAVDRVVLGLTTAPSNAADADRLCALVAAATGAHDVLLADDAVTAHAGALSMGWGISVVAGTGVASLALPQEDADGEARILGGHGYLIGDEGGAFWIGSRGINAVLRAEDGRGEATALGAAAERRFGPLADLHVRLHEADRPVNAIAHFAPEVLDAAAAGDPVAAAIAEAAANELVLVLAAAAARAGGPDRSPAIPTALGGRLLAPGTELRRRLDDAIVRARLPLVPRSADATALDGAVLLGCSPVHRYGTLVHRWPGGPA